MYQTDTNGNKIVIQDNKVTTENVANGKNASRMASYLKDEENMKQDLIQKLNSNVVEGY